MPTPRVGSLNIYRTDRIDCVSYTHYMYLLQPHTHTEYDDDGSPDLSTVKPMIDGGTEGFAGHARFVQECCLHQAYQAVQM